MGKVNVCCRRIAVPGPQPKRFENGIKARVKGIDQDLGLPKFRICSPWADRDAKFRYEASRMVRTVHGRFCPCMQSLNLATDYTMPFRTARS